MSKDKVKFICFLCFLYTTKENLPLFIASIIRISIVIADIFVFTKDIYLCDNDYHCHLRNINFRSPFPYTYIYRLILGVYMWLYDII